MVHVIGQCVIPFEGTEVKSIIVAVVHPLVISGNADAVMSSELEVQTDFRLAVHGDLQVLVRSIVNIGLGNEQLLVFRHSGYHSVVEDVVVV